MIPCHQDLIMKKSPNPDPPSRQPETMEGALAAHQKAAAGIEQVTVAGILATCDQGHFNGESLAYKAYRDNVLAKCGAPHDPIEIMLLEQLMMAQMAIGNLHVSVAGVTDANAVGMIMSAIGRLMAEFRKTALGNQTVQDPRAAGPAYFRAAAKRRQRSADCLPRQPRRDGTRRQKNSEHRTAN